MILAQVIRITWASIMYYFFLTSKSRNSADVIVLTSSLRTPKIFIKEFGDFLMSCHQHCLGVNLLVQR